MEHYVWLALVATLGTWFVTALGAATVVFFKSPSAKALNLMLGFSSGVMIAASFWSLLAPSIEMAEGGPVTARHPAGGDRRNNPCMACGGIRVPAGGAVPVGVG